MRCYERDVLTTMLLALLLPVGAHAAAGSAAGLEPAASTGPPASVVLWQPGDPGERLFLRGRVVDPEGRPLAGVRVSLRQADGNGNYHDIRYRATLETSDDGTFNVSTVLPGQYWGPKHIHLLAVHERHGQLVTRILFKGDPYVDQARPGDFAILLEEVHKDGEKILMGGVELVLPPRVGN